MSNPVNVIRVDTLNEKMQEFELVKNTILYCLQFQEETPKDFIFKKYVEVQNSVLVARHLNDNGYTIQGRKYISNDIGDMVKKADENKPLERLAKALYQYNKSKITWKTVVKVCMEIKGV